MRRQGPLSIRHLVVAALVVVVVNAQLSWWVIYFLRENRIRLRLERSQVVTRCEGKRDAIVTELAAAERVLDAALSGGVARPAGPPPAPFVRWTTGDGDGCTPGWHDDGEALAFSVATDGSCLRAVTSGQWRSELLAAPPGTELGPPLDRHRGRLPESAELRLPEPLDHLVVRPLPGLWHELLDGYRSRIKMVVAESSFFALLLFVMIALLWKTVRREVELERQHRNFLSAITHELKSPLASMRLSLETVLRGRAEGGASMRFLENALQDTERLQSLVQKVLEVTRFGRDDGTLDLRRSCVTELLDDALYTFSRRATSAGARVHADLAPSVWAEIDQEAFAIVISNLLENAIKYGGTLPQVSVRLWLEGETAVIEVEDNGRGISAEELPFIFNRFFRCGDEMTRTAEGTGLGLYLVRQIVLAHHGTVQVQSTGAAGTTFRVRLPNAIVWEDGV